MAKRPKHTPGPWRVGGMGTTVLCGDHDPLIVCHTEGSDVLHVGNNPDGSEDGRPEANARLIASAPDLLAVAQELVSWERGSADTLTLIAAHARAAIATAGQE